MPLPSKTKKVLNDISNVRDLGVNLGDLIEDLLDSLPDSAPEGGVKNAVAAAAYFQYQGEDAVKHGQRVTINNPNVAGVDVYEFVSTAEPTPISEGAIVVDISSIVQVAEGSITIAVQPVAGDKVSVGLIGASTNEYIFVPKGTDTAPGEVPIGDSLAETQASLVSAINGTDQFETPDPYVRASDFETDISTITPLWGGAIGNDVELQETFTSASNTVSSPTGGADCELDDAIGLLSDVVDMEGTQEVFVTTDLMGRHIKALDYGAFGNEISVSATRVGMGGGTPSSNIMFVDENYEPTNTLKYGIDATVSKGPKMYLGDGKIYFTRVPNGKGDANWATYSLD